MRTKPKKALHLQRAGAPKGYSVCGREQVTTKSKEWWDAHFATGVVDGGCWRCVELRQGGAR